MVTAATRCIPAANALRRFTFYRPHPALANAVEGILAIDIPDCDEARALAFRVLPAVSPVLCFHTHAPTVWTSLANNNLHPQRMTGVMTRAVTLRPSGPLRSVIVRLRPEAGIRLFGFGMDDATDVAIPLRDVFGPEHLSMLDGMLSESRGPAARVAGVQSLLMRLMPNDAPDLLIRQAANWLRRDPGLPVEQLASRLDISERHLSRRFCSAVGVSPKQFARIVRIEKVVAAARQQGTGWTDIAQSCGFNDQAHMIKDFGSMVGSSPKAFFRTNSVEDERGLNASLAVSNFYNTFVFNCGASSDSAAHS